ncbi:MAG: alpha/beta fold hydrolase [Candidatus Dormibacteria bacterium]
MPIERPRWPPLRGVGTVDGHRVSWLDRPGSDPAVVLLHGWGSSAASFLGLLRRSTSSRRLLALDLPGFGESPVGPGGWTTTRYADLVAAWTAAQLGVGYSLLGHSYGGAVSMRLAIGRPGPDRLLLCAASGIRPPSDERGAKGVSVFRALRAGARALPPPLSTTAVEWLSRHFGSADYRAAGPQLRPTLVAAVMEDLSEIAARIDIPTLLVWGAADSELPLNPHSQRLRQLIAPAELVTFENSGHFPFVDEADRFARVFDAFMDVEI